ncbi:MAG: transposase [Nitrososphaerota archaeon]|jgi:hypothetical protein|nr:transposase [Nitrososphaerota archaeon]
MLAIVLGTCEETKNIQQSKTTILQARNKLVPHCNQPLKQTHIAWHKNIFTLKQTLHITSYAYKCKNKTCQNTKETYRSTKAETYSLKYYQYGIDIITKIGHLYFQNHQTIDQIKQTLTNQHKHLQISSSEINLLTQAYLALIKADTKQNPTHLNKIKNNGGIILAIDGVQPEKGNQTLWILRDHTTQTTLLAKNLDTADKTSIVTLLKEIKKIGLPVKAVISDGQRSIRLAVKQEFPDVPHQLCHFHFLRNIANTSLT